MDMLVPLDVINIISSYTVYNKYKLIDSIPIDWLTFSITWFIPSKYMLIFNSDFNWVGEVQAEQTAQPQQYNQIHLLDSTTDRIGWQWVSINQNITIKKPLEIYYKSYHKSLDPYITNPLEQYRNNINWDLFIYNPKLFDTDIIRTNKKITSKSIRLDLILN